MHLFTALLAAAAISVPSDSPRWDLQGQTKTAEYQGRQCLLLDGGAAILKDFELRDGVIDVDVATPANRGFFGFDLTWPSAKNSCSQPKHGLPAAKNSSSTFALSKPDNGPQSGPRARAARIMYAPCKLEFRFAVASTRSALF